MSLILKFNLFFLVILSAACATPYYGQTKNEWDKLPEKDQKAIQTEYDEIIFYKNQQQHQNRIEDRRQQVIRRGVNYK